MTRQPSRTAGSAGETEPKADSIGVETAAHGQVRQSSVVAPISKPASKVWKESRALDDGVVLHNYEICSLIGRGGMSEVYEASHIGLKKRVALKLLRPDWADHQEARARFLAEGECAARIRHPNVVDVTDVGEVDGLPYLVMELLEGEDLGALFEREGPLAPQAIAELLIPVLCAIHLAHARGVIHRDLKPENIFLHAEGRTRTPKVLDFGISRLTQLQQSARLTLPSLVLGTPYYMAPEQARGDDGIDGRIDQYAVGVLLYQGLTGKLPIETDAIPQLLQRVAEGQFSPPSAHVALPPELERAVLKAMARDPAERFESALALAQALMPFTGASFQEIWDDLETMAEAHSTSRIPKFRESVAALPAGEPRKRWSWRQSAVAFGSVLVAGALFWLGRLQTSDYSQKDSASQLVETVPALNPKAGRTERTAGLPSQATPDAVKTIDQAPKAPPVKPARKKAVRAAQAAPRPAAMRPPNTARVEPPGSAAVKPPTTQNSPTILTPKVKVIEDTQPSIQIIE